MRLENTRQRPSARLWVHLEAILRKKVGFVLPAALAESRCTLRSG